MTRAITGGVDTHADVHVAAAFDPLGGLLGVQEFPATLAGYGLLLGWLGGFGSVCLVGIEGTGSYGAGLARHVTAAGVRVVEVDRSDRLPAVLRGRRLTSDQGEGRADLGIVRSLFLVGEAGRTKAGGWTMGCRTWLPWATSFPFFGVLDMVSG